MNHCLYFYIQKILDIRVSLFILFLYGCNKIDTTRIGNELIPGSDTLATDTFYLNVETKLRNVVSINLDSTAIQKNEAHCFGYINDPEFGKTTAAIYLQTLPLRYPLKFPVSKDSLFLDSLVLSLSYTGTYGEIGRAHV